MNKKAFTLIELLVVIAIIALLLGILMPALALARKQGKSVSCRNNLRQFVIATGVYTASNNSFYPPSYTKDPDPSDPLAVSACWDFTRFKDFNKNRTWIEPGLLWSAGTVEEVQQCPSFKGNPNSDDPYSGYNYNVSYVGRGEFEYPTTAKAEHVRRPARCTLFGDGEYYDGANKYMRSPFKCRFDRFAFRAAGTQGFRHNEKTNIAWADGHVTSQKECYTETLPGEKVKLDQYNETARVKIGFISPDNSAYDLK